MNERLEIFENLSNIEIVRHYHLDRDGIDHLNQQYGERYRDFVAIF
jgi:hypothetical protein